MKLKKIKIKSRQSKRPYVILQTKSSPVSILVSDDGFSLTIFDKTFSSLKNSIISSGVSTKDFSDYLGFLKEKEKKRKK